MAEGCGEDRVVALANARYFGLLHRVDDRERAVAVISAVVARAVETCVDRGILAPGGRSPDWRWPHAAATAAAAAAVAERAGLRQSDAFAAGLVHELGLDGWGFAPAVVDAVAAAEALALVLRPEPRHPEPLPLEHALERVGVPASAAAPLLARLRRELEELDSVIAW